MQSVNVNGKASIAVTERRSALLGSSHVVRALTPTGETAWVPNVEFLVLSQPSKFVAIVISDGSDEDAFAARATHGDAFASFMSPIETSPQPDHIAPTDDMHTR